ncbi:MAG: MaoC/PaaZ C-terminal domain-containing protein [Pseudomonadota bacterium]
MTREKSIDIKPGDTFHGPSKTLTDAHFLLFSGVTGDVHPIHYDVEYARQSHYGKPLAHGLLLTSLTALGASSGRELIDGFIFVEQGCRFLMPALVGDTVRPQFVVEKIWNEEHRRFCRFTTSLLNQRGEKLLEGFHVYRVMEHKTTPEQG